MNDAVLKPFLKRLIRHKAKIIIAVSVGITYYFCLPGALFREPVATVIESADGRLLGARIAEDGQWRFPESDSIPEKFKQCILYVEDEYFYKHPGFNPVSIVKSIAENIKAGKIVRGGSTITQQVIRLSRKKKKRTYIEKSIELVLATRLELRHTKADILKLYVSHAPFGGNVVGLEAASWRYFGVQPHQLSWAESATLAVLPNAPGLIYPGRNQTTLLQRRNRLLRKLTEHHIIDSLTYRLALAEALPERPFPLPQHAPHALQYLAKTQPEARLKTTIDHALQQRVNHIVKRHYEVLRQNEIHNAAVLVMDVKSRKVLAYVGNTPTDKNHQKDVNIIHAPRSTGSVLKPFLYAAMLDAGDLLPHTLVADVPTQIAGYSPQNFDKNYSGAVPAGRALARSLNVPAVRLLNTYGLERFADQLHQLGLTNIDKAPDHYGLSLILGGAESNLWELCKSYAAMAATVRNFNATSGEYFSREFAVSPVLLAGKTADIGQKTKEKVLFDAGSLYLTFEAMKEVNRPEGDEAWAFFDSAKKIAWKTGTSFGNRDAWAIGVTGDYVVGVWVGNADGEGRPDLTGISSAAPVLFDVFDVLPRSDWFAMPYDALTEVELCTHSGYLATGICPEKKTWIPHNGRRFKACPFHQLVHLDTAKQYRLNTSCTTPDTMITTSWFVLPPLMAYYFKTTNATYKTLPPYREDCDADTQAAMDFIYPKANGNVTLPKDFNGETNALVLSIAHTKPECTVFWYIDAEYLGQTNRIHQMEVLPEAGRHTITAVDEFGNEIRRTLTIVR